GHKLCKSSRRHEAIGIEDDEVRVGSTEAFNPIAYVSGLSAGIGGAPADVDRHAGAAANVIEDALLAKPLLRILRVAENEDVEQGGATARSQTLSHGLDGFCNG